MSQISFTEVPEFPSTVFHFSLLLGSNAHQSDSSADEAGKLSLQEALPVT
jgi:hypothetical protein